MGVVRTFFSRLSFLFPSLGGWSDGAAMMLDNIPVPERSTYLDKSRARASCACSTCGWGLFGHFSLIYHFSFRSSSLRDGPIYTEILPQRAVKHTKPTNQPIWETARYRLAYCLKGPLNPKQPTNRCSFHLLITRQTHKTKAYQKHSYLYVSTIYIYFDKC